MALVIGLSGVVVPAAPADATARTAAPPSVADVATRALLKSVSAIAAKAFTPQSARKTLLTSVRTSLAEIDGASWCAALDQLETIPPFLQGAVGSPPPLRDATAHPIDATVEGIEAIVLGGVGAGRCGGAAAAESPFPSPLTTLTSSDNQQVTMHIAFPAPVFAPKRGNGTDYFEMTGPNEGDGGDVGTGQPETPLTSETIAVPIGATPTVQVLDASSYDLPGVALWPLQKYALTPVGTNPLPPPIPPFKIDPAAYASDAPFPAQPTSLGAVTSERDLRLVTLTVSAARYIPARQALTVFTGIDIQVSFGGDNTGSFGTTDITGPWNTTFESIYQSSVVNWPTVGAFVSPPSVAHIACGEEMMVITDTKLEAQADAFAADRTAHGVDSRVFLVDGPGGIGPSPIGIRNKIAQEYESQCVTHPSFVTLFGDTAAVPTFEITLPGNPLGENPVATDQPYGMIHQAPAIDAEIYTDLRPDILVGRVPAPDTDTDVAQFEAGTINAYEDDPPTSAHFYGHVTATEFFQPCPDVGSDCHDSHGKAETPSTQDELGMLLASETALQDAAVAGKTVDRVAQDEAANDPGVTINPQTFDNGTPIPTGINWNGTDNDVANDVNAGSFLVWNSDHGYTDGSGWYQPSFTNNDIGALFPEVTKGLPPVVWAANCDSGKFDDPTSGEFPTVTPVDVRSNGEQWLESDSAVGFFGSSRESSEWWGHIDLESMATNVFPEQANFWRAFVSAPLQQPVLGLGAILAAVDANVIGQADMVHDIGAQGAVFEYNLMGDPSMAMRRDKPIPLDTAHFTGVLHAANDVSVSTARSAADGALVTLVKNGKYIGRGIIAGGTADVATVVNLKSLHGVEAIVAGDPFIATTAQL